MYCQYQRITRTDGSLRVLAVGIRRSAVVIGGILVKTLEQVRFRRQQHQVSADDVSFPPYGKGHTGANFLRRRSTFGDSGRRGESRGFPQSLVVWHKLEVARSG